jgi:YegS/Rv2252/BmrU family lipid kinase
VTFSLHWFVIVNPCAGGYKAQKQWAKLKTALQQHNVEHDYALTEYQAHAKLLVKKAIEQGYRQFIVVGGDGSINEVVNGFFKQQYCAVNELTLAVLPCGTGNDWAAYYQLPKNTQHFIEMIKQGYKVQQDIGCAEYNDSKEAKIHYFINFCGTGFDTFVLDTMKAADGKRYRYLLHVLQCLWLYKAPVFHLITENVQLKQKALMIMACIGKFGGAGMKFAPKAVADDGLFNILHINDMPVLKRAASVLYLFNGKVNEHKEVTASIDAKLVISAESELPFQCDGEIIAMLPVSLSILPKVLNVVVDKKH